MKRRQELDEIVAQIMQKKVKRNIVNIYAQVFCFWKYGKVFANTHKYFHVALRLLPCNLRFANTLPYFRNYFYASRRSLILISLIGLVGCSSSLNSAFDCPLTPGVVCKSLDQVNAAVNRGELGKDSCIGKNCISNKSKNNRTTTNIFSTPYPMIMKTGEPLRYGERVIRVWIAPYEDDVGNYHQGTIINAVAKKGHWIANPPKVILED